MSRRDSTKTDGIGEAGIAARGAGAERFRKAAGSRRGHMIKTACTLLFLVLTGILATNVTMAVAEEQSAVGPIHVQRIWDRAPYNSFTDLARFQGRWYCAFREGTGHVCPHGKLRVIASDDGEKWESAALMTYEGGDLRDGKLSVTPDGRLMLSGAVRLLKPVGGKQHQSLCWTSTDGKTWSERQAIGDPNYWLWSVTWLPASQDNAGPGVAGRGYSFGYKTVNPRGLRLYQLQSDGGKVTSRTWADVNVPVKYPNESSLVFAPDGTGYCLLRTEKNAWLGTSAPPYRDWKWKETNVYFGGPKMIRLADGRLLGGGRLVDNRKGKTGIVLVDFENPRIEEIVRLPSGGDTSYPGMVVQADTLWMSYYSGHEGKVCIYLAKIPLKRLLSAVAPAPGGAVDIGSRRELFVDDYLIDKLEGAAHPDRFPDPLFAKDTTGRADLHEQPRRRYVHALEGAGHPHQRPGGPGAQSQQLHGLGACETARRTG